MFLRVHVRNHGRQAARTLQPSAAAIVTMRPGVADQRQFRVAGERRKNKRDWRGAPGARRHVHARFQSHVKRRPMAHILLRRSRLAGYRRGPGR